ncbi:hypothetical protein SAMN05421666_0027 [Roseovarius nanhaiticus]|uniref:Uncharacterized protein n=1 Tax=Roseovarius nanhaiticus TaxID=573024 RepID=A0A1N7E7V2_9RHOB|nr:hypothetical protein SAMN05216208_2107 [Roseovarius nanhaiticus]SIR84088.1 hypothetical protein SAMN05421666_0027 [Roseovarius nanhaiticus]
MTGYLREEGNIRNSVAAEFVAAGFYVLCTQPLWRVP